MADMMNEMVERVAGALWVANSKDRFGKWSGLEGKWKDKWRDDARAAIEAMRAGADTTPAVSGDVREALIRECAEVALKAVSSAPQIEGKFGWRDDTQLSLARIAKNAVLALSSAPAGGTAKQCPLDMGLDSNEGPRGCWLVGQGLECVCEHMHFASLPKTDPEPGRVEQPRWRHKQRGTTYTEIGRGRFQGEVAGMDIGDYEPVVLYRSDKDGSLWVRTTEQFEDGRFEAAALQQAPGTDAAETRPDHEAPGSQISSHQGSQET